ncbi:MAG: putative Ig domain-containing protein [Actinomycetales bacterium]
MSTTLRSPIAALISVLLAALAISLTAVPASAASATSLTYTIDTSSPTYDRLIPPNCSVGGPTANYKVIQFETVQDVNPAQNNFTIAISTTAALTATLYQGVFLPTNPLTNCYDGSHSIASPSGSWNTGYGGGGTNNWYLVLASDSPTPSVTVSATMTTSIGTVREVLPPPPDPTITVTPATLPAGTLGSAYSQTLTASGGTSPYEFYEYDGRLPTGLTLTTAGLLSGTPTATGSFTFTVDAFDADSFQGSRTYTIAVNPPPVNITTTSLPAASAGSPYSQAIAAEGGTAPYTYALTSGALPTGVSLSTSGALSGTPTAAGSFTFEITATDSTSGTALTDVQAYTMAVALPTVTLDPSAPPGSQIGTAYSHVFSASGGVAPYTYAVTGGSLPTGLTLSAGGTLSGTPTSSGSFTFTLTATDSTTGTGPAFQAAQYTLLVAGPEVTITPDTLPGATAGAAYSQTLTAGSGTAPYTFAVTGGSLPAGLALTTDGTLSGTPTEAGPFSFTVTATDSTPGTAGSGQVTYALEVALPMVSISTTSLPDGTSGSAYSATMAAEGGVADYTYALTEGPLPAGLTLNSNGTVTGTPTEAGTFTVTVEAMDSTTGTGPATGSRQYTFDVALDTIVLEPSTLAGPVDSDPYDDTVTASGGMAPYVFELASGSLPPGLSLNDQGSLTGTPNLTGTFTFEIRATDSTTGTGPATGTRNYTVTVAPMACLSENLELTAGHSWDSSPATVLGLPYRLFMQTDGNAVLYAPDGKATWNTGTAGHPGARLVMQGDGNLVVYSADGQARWSSGSSTGCSKLFVQTDGNIVIYKPATFIESAWYSGADHLSAQGVPVTGPSISRGQALRSGMFVVAGQYRLIMQVDGNLVLYGPGGAVWQSDTHVRYAFVVLQGDGNLVMYSRTGQYLWGTGTQHRDGTELRLQADGNLVLYRRDGTYVWHR